MGMNTNKDPIMSVFLKYTAIPKPLKIPSNVKAIELNGCAIIIIQKVLLNRVITSGFSLNKLPITG